MEEIEILDAIFRTRERGVPSGYSVPSPDPGILVSGIIYGALMRSGQSTVEYLLTLSVVSIAIVAIMLSFDAVFSTSVSGLSQDMAADSLTNQGVQSP
jgi:hypothetical protein